MPTLPHPLLEGPLRDEVDATERRTLETDGSLVIDPRRRRPRYFDGRFLAARDLTADQRYVMQRQADLARAGGWGVSWGLEVVDLGSAARVRIQAGQGVTPAGETVVLTQDVEVDLLALDRSLLLDGHLGLREDKTALARARSGPFVLALRPVEYTANPRRAYPTSVYERQRDQGKVTVEDHDVVEATAVTLVPWPSDAKGGPDAVRRQLAREVFVVQDGRGVAADLLPVAMVYLDAAALVWLDVELARRPVGAAQEDLLGLGLITRGVRAAHVRQYRNHLDQALAAAGNRSLAAAEAFDALPPVGQLPARAIDGATFTQTFFPPEVDVDISFVPADELPVLIEESLMLPPIDLAAGTEALTGTAVLILVPISRADMRAFKQALEHVRRPLTRRIGLYSAARTPLLALSRLRLPTVATDDGADGDGDGDDVATDPWTEFYASALGQGDGLLWYVRRRNLNTRAELAGAVIDLDNPA